ncbi:restriction endonuclease subunit S [Coprococcus comes]|uniref:restriction endonuclease subunit S n=1 Tax=Coprococcus comes TaxID=410072 RepID=UPI00321928D1
MPYEKIGKNEPVCIADDVPFEIPDSWEWLRLGSIGDWGSGATPSRSVPEYYGGDIPWLKTGDLNDGHIEYIPEKISHLALEKTSVRLNPTGSVLIAMYGATIGKVGILTFPATTNQACCACLPIEIYNEYLFYFLMSQKVAFVKQGEGGAQPNISKAKIVATLMPLPPLAEQYRIVAKIKEVIPHIEYYGEIHSSVSSLNASFPNLLKKSILQEAVQGKLVPQDPTDEPASVLLEHIRAEKEQLIKAGKIKRDKNESIIFRRDNSHYEKLDGVERCIDDEIPFEIPESWAWTRIGSITELITSGSRDWAKYYAETGALFLRMGNLSKNSFTLRLNNLQRVQLPQKAEGTRTALQAGDLLFSITGEVGMLGLIPDKFETAYVNQHIAVLRFFPDIRNKYLPYLLLTDYAQKFYKGNQHGIKNSFRLDSIYNVLVPIPPSQEQKRIIDKIEKLFHKITVI